MTFKNPIIGGNDTLVRQAMQSEGFADGTGWRITRDGDAEFNSLVVNGQITAGDSALVVGDLGVNGDILMGVEPGQWILRGVLTAPTFATGWSNFGGSFQTAAHVEMPEGFGQLIGVVSGTPPGTIFTVPTSLRPSLIQGPFICACNDGKSAQVVINTNGTVVAQNADSGVTWISLASCRWPISGFPEEGE